MSVKLAIEFNLIKMITPVFKILTDGSSVFRNSVYSLEA
jgi:hypothetical protein